MTASTSKAARVSSLAGVTKVAAKTSKADKLVVGAYLLSPPSTSSSHRIYG